METSSPQPDFETLLHRVKLAEKRLDEATENIESNNTMHVADLDKNTSALSSKIEKEKCAAETWETHFKAMLAYTPNNFEELKFKNLTLVEYVKNGYDNPRIFEAMKNDLQEFTLHNDIATKTKEKDNRRAFLIIDDSQIDRMLLKKALSRQQDNLDFIELEDGTNVVEVIKQTNPCATLIDVRMPHINGFEVLKLIKDDPDLIDHPVWILSNSSDEINTRIALQTGANGFYTKPNSIAEYTELATEFFQ